MQFTLPRKELKPRGYTFQKLYAHNYITYRKKFDIFTIWLWLKGHELEINDWYGATETVINFFKNLPQAQQDSKYLVLQLNREKRKVHIQDREAYWEQLKIPDNPYFDEWSETIIHTETFKVVLKEVEFLTR